MIGRTLLQYRITGLLGAGGMGEVYLAEDTRLGRRVALKVLPEELSGDAGRLERLEREARALAALDHPHIVTLYTVEEAEGVHFLTMAHVEGRTLDELIPAGGLPPGRLLELAVPVVDAVRSAHERGVVHRDLKPANVMVDGEGRPRVLDFGLAKLREGEEVPGGSRLATEAMTEEGSVLGSYPYMSPEQVEGRPADERSDVFSLGVMLHEMATGSRPFGGKTRPSLAAAILREKPPAVDTVRPELPHHLGRIIGRCLEKDPERRYQRAKDLLHELEDLRREEVAPTGAPPAAARPMAGRRRGLVASVAVLAVVTVGIGLWVTTSRAPPKPAASGIRSVAVLPLVNRMRDPEQEYFVDGMTEALIADLAKLGGLKVISRTSVMRYKDTAKSVPEIARELDVDALLEGSVMRAGGRVKITAQLVDGSDETVLLTETHERTLTDVLSLHSEVARAIAGRIRLQLSPGEEELLAAPRPVDPEAYEAYLRGMFHLWQFTPQGVQNAAENLQRALELDPELAAAHAALANLHFYLGFVGVVPPTQAMPLARKSALRAVEIDERNAHAHVMLGFLHLTYDLDFPAGRREAERALEINPNHAQAHWLYSVYLSIMGDFDRALAEVRTARQLDPFEALWSAGEALYLGLLGRRAEALEHARHSLQLNPQLHWGHNILSFLLIEQGQEEEGLREKQEYYRLIGLPNVADALDEGFRRGGLEAAYLAAARALERQREEQPVSASEIGALLAMAGAADEAFVWLERAVEERDGFLYWLRRDSALVGLTDDPRFDALARRLGLPD